MIEVIIFPHYHYYICIIEDDFIKWTSIENTVKHDYTKKDLIKLMLYHKTENTTLFNFYE